MKFLNQVELAALELSKSKLKIDQMNSHLHQRGLRAKSSKKYWNREAFHLEQTRFLDAMNVAKYFKLFFEKYR
jgi:hypothetical protein